MQRNTEILSLKDAQNIILNSQKLVGPILTPLKIIRHLGHVQIDTISVVERAHHHVFWTHNPSYKPTDLDKLVKSRKVFEYWSHAASYLPMNEYRFTLPMKKAFKKRENSWFPRDPKLMAAVLKRIKEEGPLRSKDFEKSKKGNTGWWDLKPAKKALEKLFLEGKLEVSKREGFQKVYDLPERVIPSSINTECPSDKDYIRFLIMRNLRHHGLSTVGEISYLKRKEIKTMVTDTIAEMLEEGDIINVKVESNEAKYYTTKKLLCNTRAFAPKILILSPFDNFIIQRKKLSAFFNFEYQIECYVPAPKRKYGYFSLPIFYGARPLGRIDCKADRKEKKLLIKSIHCEKGVDKKYLKNKLTPKLKSFAKFNNCTLEGLK